MRALAVASVPFLFVLACSSDKTTGTGGSGGNAASVTGTGSGGSGTTSSSTGAGGSGPTCGTNAWVTYGHDGQRTSASDGCIRGPLTPLWSYVPTAPMGKMLSRVFHPLAATDAIYLHWSATDPPYTGTTAADRVGLDGSRVWTFDSGTDTDLGDWASIWKDTFALDSDGIYLLDQADGHQVATSGVDWWGQSIPTDASLFVVDTSKSDGPGLFVGALDETAKVTWKQNEQGTMCGQGLADQTGGIALDGTTLFYAPLYATGSTTNPTFASGLYAFDTSNMGMPLWKVATSPASAISVANGTVFLVEGMTGMSKLTARKQSDGSVVWAVDVPGGAGVQAPVLADGKVIVGTTSGISAFGQADGASVWSQTVPAYTGMNNTPVSNGCAGLQPLANLPTTSIAVALGSATVVVAQGPNLSVLSLSTGETQWTGAQAVTGSLVNPIIVGNRVYAVDTGGSLVAFQGMMP